MLKVREWRTDGEKVFPPTAPAPHRQYHLHEISIWNKTDLLCTPVFIPPLYLSGPLSSSIIMISAQKLKSPRAVFSTAQVNTFWLLWSLGPPILTQTKGRFYSAQESIPISTRVDSHTFGIFSWCRNTISKPPLFLLLLLLLLQLLPWPNFWTHAHRATKVLIKLSIHSDRTGKTQAQASRQAVSQPGNVSQVLYLQSTWLLDDDKKKLLLIRRCAQSDRALGVSSYQRDAN